MKGNEEMSGIDYHLLRISSAIQPCHCSFGSKRISHLPNVTKQIRNTKDKLNSCWCLNIKADLLEIWISGIFWKTVRAGNTGAAWLHDNSQRDGIAGARPSTEDLLSSWPQSSPFPVATHWSCTCLHDYLVSEFMVPAVDITLRCQNNFLELW